MNPSDDGPITPTQDTTLLWDCRVFEQKLLNRQRCAGSTADELDIIAETLAFLGDEIDWLVEA